jgi:hypothetical protein
VSQPPAQPPFALPAFFDGKLHGENGCLCGGYQKGVAFFHNGSKSKCLCDVSSGSPGVGYQTSEPF